MRAPCPVIKTVDIMLISVLTAVYSCARACYTVKELEFGLVALCLHCFFNCCCPLLG